MLGLNSTFTRQLYFVKFITKTVIEKKNIIYVGWDQKMYISNLRVPDMQNILGVLLFVKKPCDAN